LTADKKLRMAKGLTIIEVAAIAIIVLSVAVLAFIGFSIWAEP
jgi:Tfp pilus assembly protein PilV